MSKVPYVFRIQAADKTMDKTVMARNIQRVNAVASAAIGLGIAVRARGLARGRIGQDPPRHGWRMQDAQLAAIDVFGGVWSSELEGVSVS